MEKDKEHQDIEDLAAEFDRLADEDDGAKARAAVKTISPRRRPGALKGKIHMGDDFDASPSDHRDFKRRMVEEAGGAVTVAQAQKLLRVKSVRVIEDAIAERRMLAVDDDGEWLIPMFQFEVFEIGAVMARILAAAPNTSAWALLQFMVAGDLGLEPDKPVDLIHGNEKDVERVIRFARALED